MIKANKWNCFANEPFLYLASLILIVKCCFGVCILNIVIVDQGINCQTHSLCPSLCLCQWAEVGLHGLNGRSVMLGAGGAGSAEHAAAPTLPLWTEEPSVRAHRSREWPAPHCAQVKMTHSSVLFITSSDKVVTHWNIRKFPKWAILQGVPEWILNLFRTSAAGFQLCSSAVTTLQFLSTQKQLNPTKRENHIWSCNCFGFVMKTHLHQEHSVSDLLSHTITPLIASPRVSDHPDSKVV